MVGASGNERRINSGARDGMACGGAPGDSGAPFTSRVSTPDDDAAFVFCASASDGGGAASTSCARVALVGAGPGDPGLVTVRGRALIARADVLVYDRLVAPELVALAAHAELVNVGKHQGSHPVPQGRINEMLVEKARALGPGKLVVRLKGGDPYLFGRGGEEGCFLAEHGVPFEVVPGVTSAFAALAYAGVPVTDRRAAASAHVVTGHRQKNGALGIDFPALVRAGGTCVFLMAVATMGEICAGLVGAGMDPATPAVAVERGTTADQRSVRGAVGDIADRAARAGVQSPAVLAVGDVVRFAPQLNWFDRLPLRGRTVLVTRPRDRARGLVGKLTERGARVRYLPCIETRRAPDEALARAVRRLPEFGWVALTSTFGVSCLFRGIEAAGLDVRCLARVRIAAIGSATAAALRARGIAADYVPAVYDGAHLGRGLAQRAGVGSGSETMPVMLFRSADGTADLPDALRAAGVPYEQVDAYTTVLAPEEVPADLAEELHGGGIDLVTFTSASTVRGFTQAFGLERGSGALGHASQEQAERDALGRTPGGGSSGRSVCSTPGYASGRTPLPTAVCLGASTRAAAESYGFSCVSAQRATIDSLVAACANVGRA